ncbi:HCLS1-binding protein 3-like [Mizuhopecten yessoensis]|uniref:HCLS1-binding protein 3 n=1 Tax=Mizuhopecten yessoensis TaxID=6573 RepID=A0A210QMQ9_MIZYE|nr:HCLS1-binding protein 3-like [Mizuhopecten yessoensis]OWF50030.1 HCLS1-binding protein 3 [Mizuhopecten yessoensis]
MPSATVTVRELKNKDTCIDIAVPNYKETKGLIQSTFEYHVVVVSSLPFFKSAKHKPSDVVQYMVSKKFAEFEDLHTKLSAKFSGTVLPLLSKKALIVNDTVAKERRGNLDSFLKFIACTPKFSTASVLLEFLGVNAIKAGKYRKDEELQEDTENNKSSEDQDESSTQDRPETEQSLFDEEEEDDENADDFFSKEEEDAGGDDTLGGTGDNYRNQFQDTKLFEDQDLMGAFTEEDANDFILPGARETVTKETSSLFMDEDNSDLLQLDDDLDKFLKIKTNKPDSKPKPSPRPEEKSPKPTVPQQKPSISPKKPSVSPEKPTVSMQKLAPAPRKPKIGAKPAASQDTGAKPSIKPKPSLAAKPVLPKKPDTDGPEVKPERQAVENKVEKLDTNDIMQYIQQNTSQDDELDLFS